MENTTEKQPAKKWYKIWWVWVIILVALYAIGSNGMKNKPVTNVVNNKVSQNNEVKAPVASSTIQSKEDAQKELDDLMALSKKAGVVKSFEFSDTATVVYVEKTWYDQSVEFKKDFLAKVATLKKEINGYRHFEVLDAYSNEKVAEVTSFTNSLEVYK